MRRRSRRRNRRRSTGLSKLFQNPMLIAGAIGVYFWSQRTPTSSASGAVTSTSDQIREQAPAVGAWGDYL